MNWLKKKASPIMMEENKFDEITDSLGMLTKKIKDNKAWDESVKSAVDKLLKELTQKIVVQPASMRRKRAMAEEDKKGWTNKSLNEKADWIEENMPANKAKKLLIRLIKDGVEPNLVDLSSV